jgi:tRNA(His) 5'-end guanylyltransferase
VPQTGLSHLRRSDITAFFSGRIQRSFSNLVNGATKWQLAIHRAEALKPSELATAKTHSIQMHRTNKLIYRACGKTFGKERKTHKVVKGVVKPSA